MANSFAAVSNVNKKNHCQEGFNIFLKILKNDEASTVRQAYPNVKTSFPSKRTFLSRTESLKFALMDEKGIFREEVPYVY